MKTTYDGAVKTAHTYYNSGDADNFYYTIWGGEDIHIGLYEYNGEPIADASRRTVERMTSRLSKLTDTTQVLDLGAGYGGAARYLAETYGCNVTALNLSEVENERNREMNKSRGLDNLVEVVDGNYEQLPFEDNTFDVIWSQDAILHSSNREKVFSEISRVLKSKGELVFTDPMMSDSASEDMLQPILDRLHLENLGSPEAYRGFLSKLEFTELAFEEHREQLINHYARVLDETATREDELQTVVSSDYIRRMKMGLYHWIEGGTNKNLTWGIFHFRKE